MTIDRAQLVRDRFADAARLHQQMVTQDVTPIVDAANAISRSLANGGKLLAFGNGGSAADSQHLSAELVGRFMRERRALPAIALTTDTSILTSIGNDDDYARIFARQIEALGNQGDVALGISTSGASRNIVAALTTARARGLITISLTGGSGGEAGRLADIHVNVPESSTARVQEVHRTILHAICEIIEGDLEEAK